MSESERKNGGKFVDEPDDLERFTFGEPDDDNQSDDTEDEPSGDGEPEEPAGDGGTQG